MKLPCIGRRTAPKLNDANIFRIKDLDGMEPSELQEFRDIGPDRSEVIVSCVNAVMNNE